MVGSALVKALVKKDCEVISLTRESFTFPMEAFIEKKIAPADAVVNLAGAPVIRRWTEGWKEEIRRSRILTTRMIADAIRQSDPRPKVMISASAVGIYASAGSHREDSLSFGHGFLTEVCKEWEAEAETVKDITRLVILRLGVVLGDGGMLGTVFPLFNIGLGGKIGNGNQPFSFIHIDDLVSVIITILERPDMSGTYNAVAPWPTTNGYFTEVMGKVLNQYAFLTVPKFTLKLLFGEGATVLTEGQQVYPGRLTEAGFVFRYPTIEKALVKIYK